MKITMAHGSGGKSSAQLMKDIFGKHFKNEVLDKMEDAAVLSKLAIHLIMPFSILGAFLVPFSLDVLKEP